MGLEEWLVKLFLQSSSDDLPRLEFLSLPFDRHTDGKRHAGTRSDLEGVLSHRDIKRMAPVIQPKIERL